jgi:flagellar basal body P-ring formation protein FlgA
MTALLKRLVPVLVLASCPFALAGEPAAPAAAGAAAAAAEAAETPLSPDQLLAALAPNLQSRFGLVGELQLSFANPWMAPMRLAKVWGIAIVEYPSSAGASMVVRFRVVADSKAVAEDTVVLRASLWSDAWFAREPLASGAALDTSLIEARRIDSFRMRNAIPVGTPDTEFVLSRSIQAGAMLTWNDVGHRPLVKKGDIVEVSAREGLLRVTLKGLALQNGGLGDTVTVRNPESLKVIPAMVVGENRVEVRL